MQTNPTAVTLMTSIPLRPALGEAAGDVQAPNSTPVEGKDAWSAAINAAEATDLSVLFVIDPPTQGGAVGPLPAATSSAASVQAAWGLILAEPPREVTLTPSFQGQDTDAGLSSAVEVVNTPDKRSGSTEADNDPRPHSTSDGGGFLDKDRSAPSAASQIADPIGQTGQLLAPAQVGPSVRAEAPDSASHAMSPTPITGPTPVLAEPVKPSEDGGKRPHRRQDSAPAETSPTMPQGFAIITDAPERAPVSVLDHSDPAAATGESDPLTKPPPSNAKADMQPAPTGDATEAKATGVGQRLILPMDAIPQMPDRVAIPRLSMTTAAPSKHSEGFHRGQPEDPPGASVATTPEIRKGAAALPRPDASAPRVEPPTARPEPADHPAASPARDVASMDIRPRAPETVASSQRDTLVNRDLTPPVTQTRAQSVGHPAPPLTQTGGGIPPATGSTEVAPAPGQVQDLYLAAQETSVGDASQPAGAEQAVGQGGETFTTLSGAERHRAAPALPLTTPLSVPQAAIIVPITVPEDLAKQLGVVMSAPPDQPIELVLTPEELGRVRMVLTAQDDGLRLVVQADRPETLDLMRRHAEQLTRDFKDLGYQDISFSFDSQSGFQRHLPSRDADRREDDTPRVADRAETALHRAPVATGYRHRVATVGADGRLDLRL